LRIEVDQVPPAECSPNSRSFWAKRYKVARVYQETVYYECVNARNQIKESWATPESVFLRARLDLTFIFRQQRGRDEDNLRSRFKIGQDSLVQASLITNDTPEYLELGKIAIIVDPARAPKTIIDLQEVGR